MATYRKRDYSPRLQGRKLEIYGQVMRGERTSLVVDEARRLWILRHYPLELNGQPVLVKDEKG